jgi:SAM-dependent methyltransferase
VDNGFTGVRCGGCGIIYVTPRPSSEFVTAGVETGVHQELSGERSVVGHRAEWKVRRYRQVFGDMFDDVWRAGQPVRWLDVGAGFGEVVEVIRGLAPSGSVVEGIEPMGPKARAAQAAGIPVREGYLELGQAEPYDFISLIHVFSHLPDFRPLLFTIRDSLTASGELYLETGNIADLSDASEVPTELDLPDHLVFAGESHVRGYLEEAGFEILALEHGRGDTWLNLAKGIAKRAMGRRVALVWPGTSRYRALRIRAKRRA